VVVVVVAHVAMEKLHAPTLVDAAALVCFPELRAARTLHTLVAVVVVAIVQIQTISEALVVVVEVALVVAQQRLALRIQEAAAVVDIQELPLLAGLVLWLLDTLEVNAAQVEP
jgi:hypothetical protein